MADQLLQAGNSAAATVAPNLAPSQTGTLAPATPTQNSTVPTVMSPTQAFNNSPIPVANVQSPDTSSGLAATGQQTAKSVQDYITQLTPETTALDKQNQDMLDSIATLTGQDAGKAQAQVDAENASGATQAAKDLKDLNNRLLLANATYEQQFANLGGNGSVETSGVLNAQQAGLRRAQAADIGLITAQIQAKQGDLTLALNTASRSVDAKYSTIEDQINTKLAQIKAIQPQLDNEQKIQALAQQRKLQDQADEVVSKKDQEKSIANLMVQYPKANITANDTLVSASQKAAAWQAKNPGAGKLQVIGSHYDDYGNKVDSYGFVNETTGIVTPYNANPTPGEPSVGNTNFGLSTGTMFGLPTYNTQANNPGVNRPIRNNNPGNIKASDVTSKYQGVVGVESIAAADGGNFLIFANPQAGIAAIGQLLQNGSSYKGLTAEQAIKKYNGGGGYGASDVGLDPKKDFQSQIKDPTTLQNVATAIAKQEGFTASSPNSTQNTKGANSPTIDTSITGYTTDLVPGTGGLTQSAIDQAALNYAITGELPSGARATKGPGFAQQTAIKNRAGQLNTGGNIAANKETLKALSSTLAEQTKYFNNVDRSLTNAENTFAQINDSFKNAGINTSDSSFANAKVNDLNKFFGNNTEALRSFQAGLYELQNEYAQVFSRGGQRTLEGDKHAQDILNGNFSINDLTAIKDELNKTGEIVRTGSQDQVSKVQSQINNILSPGASNTPSSGGAPANMTLLTWSDGKQYYVPNDKVDAFKKAGGH